MSNRRATLAFVALLWALAAPGLASAAEDDDSSIEMARQRFREGIEFFDNRQYDRARAAFLQAYALKKHPAVLLNLAQSELRSKREADAANHFAEFLREASSAKPEERQAAEAGLAEAKQRVGEIFVKVDAVDAELFVNEVPLGRSPLPGPVYVKPGTHTFAARRAKREATSRVSVSPGQSTDATLTFGVASRSRTPDRSQSGADRSRGKVGGPPPSQPPDQGDAGVGADSAGFFSWYADTPGAWILTGVAGAGIATGIGFALGASSNYDSANETSQVIAEQAARDGESPRGLCTRTSELSARVGAERAGEYANACRVYRDNVDRGDLMKTLSYVGFGVAAAGAVGTIIYYVVDSGSSGKREQASSDKSFAVSPVLAPGYQGLSLHASF